MNKFIILFILLNLMIIFINSNELKSITSTIESVHHSGRLIKFEGKFNYIDNSTQFDIMIGSSSSSSDIVQPSIPCRVIESNETEVRCLIEEYNFKGCLNSIQSDRIYGLNQQAIKFDRPICNKPYVYKVIMTLDVLEQQFFITILGDNLGEFPNLGMILGSNENNYDNNKKQFSTYLNSKSRTPLKHNDAKSIANEISKDTYYQFKTIQTHYAFQIVEIDYSIALKFKEQYENNQSLNSYLVFSHSSDQLDINHIHIEPIHWEDVTIRINNQFLFFIKCFSTIVFGLFILISIIVVLDKKKSKLKDN